LADRTKHGALIDTELLAEVYLNLCEGRSPSLNLDKKNISRPTKTEHITIETTYISLTRPRSLQNFLTSEEIAAHRAFVEKFRQKSLWLDN
jgi:DNA polymerase-3 subunit epsilon